MPYISPKGTVYVAPLKSGQRPRDDVPVVEALVNVVLATAVPDPEALDETDDESLEERESDPEMVEDEDTRLLDDIAEVRGVEDTVILDVIEALPELEAPVETAVEPFDETADKILEEKEIDPEIFEDEDTGPLGNIAEVRGVEDTVTFDMTEVLRELEAPVEAAVEPFVAVTIDMMYVRVNEGYVSEPEEMGLSQVLGLITPDLPVLVKDGTEVTMPVVERALAFVGKPLLSEEARDFDNVEEALVISEEEAVFTVVGALIENEGPIAPELLARLETQIERLQRPSGSGRSNPQWKIVADG